jgi:hypothetical protein
LSQNYPNPFNPKTCIKFGLPKACEVKLELINIMGQRVKILFEGQKPAGYHLISFDASDIASGIFFYTIVTNDFCAVKKMVLIK